MSHRLHAVFDGEVLRPESPVDLEPNTRYLLVVEEEKVNSEISEETPYPLSLIRGFATDMKVTDLSTRHDYYAHGKLENQLDPLTHEVGALFDKLGPLTDKEKELIALFTQHYTLEEIADLWGEDVDSTKTRWQRLLSKQRYRALRKEMSEGSETEVNDSIAE